MVGLILTAIGALMLGAPGENENYSLRTRVCDNTPYTVVTRGEEPIYSVSTVMDYDTGEEANSCGEWLRDPINFSRNSPNGLVRQSPQRCRFAKVGEVIPGDTRKVTPENSLLLIQRNGSKVIKYGDGIPDEIVNGDSIQVQTGGRKAICQ
jgi:hypothetical protein